MQPCDREGTFKAVIESYGIKEMPDSGSVAISLQAHLTDFWNGEGWESWGEYQMDAPGDIWIIGSKDKGNKINESQVTALVKNAGWDGDTDSIVNQTWKPIPCQVVVQKDEYKGKTRFKIGFINAFESVPGGQMTNVDATKATEIKTKYGAQLRAIAGNAKRNGSTAPTTTRPAAPPPAPAKATVPAGQPTGFEPIPQ